MIHTVKSKYKNPDKYIEQLRQRCDKTWSSSRYYQNLYTRQLGSESIYLAKDFNKIEFSIGTRSLSCFNPLDTVFIEGEVTSVAAIRDRSSEIVFRPKVIHMKKHE